MNNHIYNQKEKIFDRWASSYDFLFTTVFYQAVHKRLLEYVELPAQPYVLDLGCGTGRLLNRLATQFPSLRGIGLDLSREMIRQARQHNRYRKRLIYLKGNAESFPFANGQFNAVFNTISFLHYPHPDWVFSEVSRVLQPKGRFYLVDSQLGEGRNKNNFPLIGKLKFYTEKQREQLGIEVGLECLGHHYLLGPIVLTIFSKK